LSSFPSGKNRVETAAALGVAQTTARTHLNSIFAKTGVSRQSGLVRLAMQTAPPLRVKVGFASLTARDDQAAPPLNGGGARCLKPIGTGIGPQRAPNLPSELREILIEKLSSHDFPVKGGTVFAAGNQ
jgi:hypothetical protein